MANKHNFSSSAPLKIHGIAFVVFGIMLTSTCFADTTNTAVQASNVKFVASQSDPNGRSMLQAAQQMITAYHEGHVPSTNLLHVVYFVPKDVAPFTNYTERLDRIVSDVSRFYRDGLERFGIHTAGLPLDRKDGKLVVHLVRGQQPASDYNYDSGDQTAQEIRQSLKGILNLDHEFLLVFYALCDKTSTGRYVFHSPYYGGGWQQGGLCHAADCELLDPLLLMETNRRMIFTEHYYPLKKMSVAQFNSWYLGGVAHELGHALGLPHDDGSPVEKAFGVSLMGAGNLNYREEIWGGGPPAYLARASALQLVSHPLITDSNCGRWDDPKGSFKSLRFSATNGVVRIQGVVTGAIPAYAVIAYVWPGSDDHHARTFPCVISNGHFTLDLNNIQMDNSRRFNLKLARLYVNGATETEHLTLSYNESLIPDVESLNTEWIEDQAETAVMQGRPDARNFVGDAALASAPTPEAAQKFRLLREVLDPPAPNDLGAVKGNSTYLSNAIWTEAKVGWGQVARNYFWFDQNIQNGVFLALGGQFFDKGLYAHSPSRFVFPVARKWKTFTAIIGLRDGAESMGSAVFTVRGDGRLLYRSHVLRVGQREEVKVDISQVNKLELLTEGGEGHNHFSWAIWAEPKVQR